MESHSSLLGDRTPTPRPPKLVFAANLLIVVPLLLCAASAFLIFIGTVLAGDVDASIVPFALPPILMLIAGASLSGRIKEGDDVARWTAAGVLVFGVSLGIADLFDGRPSVMSLIAIGSAIGIALLLDRQSAAYSNGSMRVPREAVITVTRAAAALTIVAAVAVLAIDSSEARVYPLIGYVAGAVLILLLATGVRRGERVADAAYVIAGVVMLASGVGLGIVHAIEQESVVTAGAVPIALAAGILAIAGRVLAAPS